MRRAGRALSFSEPLFRKPAKMPNFKPTEHQHVRYNPLKDEWVLVSPHRCLRPWAGQTEQRAEEGAADDEENPLRPGALRASGQKNPMYTSTYVFPNDFPALLERVPEPPATDDPLFQMSSAKGSCRVMCFHPDSKITLPLMSVGEILAVIKEWINQTVELGRRYKWVQIFENKGSMMGCSNPHPHCQIWSSNYLPNEARIKDRCQSEYYNKHGSAMLTDYTEKELLKQERIVFQNDEWLVLVPFWAVWPFETLVLPKHHQPQRFTDLTDAQATSLAEVIKQLTTKYDNLFECRFPYSMGWHVFQNDEWLVLVPFWAVWPFETLVLPKHHQPQRFTDLTDAQATSLAEVIKQLTTKYDNLFECRFPYSMGWHGAPTGPLHKKGDSPHWVFHGLFLPPLLRGATVKKFMVGYELLAQSQRDLTAEQAAERLRGCDEERHYSVKI